MPFTSTHFMDKYVRPNWKAVLGFFTPAATSLTYAVTEASAGGENITQAEWVTALCAAFLTGGLVYGKANTDPLAQRQDESVQPPTPYEPEHRADDPGEH